MFARTILSAPRVNRHAHARGLATNSKNNAPGSSGTQGVSGAEKVQKQAEKNHKAGEKMTSDIRKMREDVNKKNSGKNIKEGAFSESERHASGIKPPKMNSMHPKQHFEKVEQPELGGIPKTSPRPDLKSVGAAKREKTVPLQDPSDQVSG